ncbi:MAG: hypothetical protein WAO58_04235 [Fimbriimonadaceae bacterium]
MNELLDAALGQGATEKPRHEYFRVKPLPLSLGSGVDPTRLREVLSDLEAEQA